MVKQLHTNLDQTHLPISKVTHANYAIKQYLK